MVEFEGAGTSAVSACSSVARAALISTMGNQGPTGLSSSLSPVCPRSWPAAFPGQGRLCVSPCVLSFLTVPSLRRQLSLRLTHLEGLSSGLVSSSPCWHLSLSAFPFQSDFYLSGFSPQGTWSRRLRRSCENMSILAQKWLDRRSRLSPGPVFSEGSSPGCPRHAAESQQPVLLSFRPTLPVSNV